MTPWRTSLERLLSASDAPAALDRGLLERFAGRARGAPIAASTLTHWLADAQQRGRLTRVSRGIYLNAFRPVAGTPADAAHLMRRDAVVSLNTVLGDAGILNNPSATVTAIVPLDARGPKPPVGRVKTAIGWYHFFAMPRTLLEAGSPDDRIDARYRDHIRATPERALVDWLYLARSRLSHRTAPNPGDLDLSLMDQKRLWRLATDMDVEASLESLTRPAF
jgi:hypothetical protein